MKNQESTKELIEAVADLEITVDTAYASIAAVLTSVLEVLSRAEGSVFRVRLVVEKTSRKSLESPIEEAENR